MNRTRASAIDAFGTRDQRNRIYPALSGSGSTDGANWEADFSAMSGATDLTAAGFTYTRTGTATYINSSGFVTTASANQPRFDCSPTASTTAGTCRGLLIETASVGNMIYSTEDMAAGNWGTGSNTVLTYSSATVNPRNSTGATKLSESSGTSGSFGVYQGGATASITSGNTYTFSCWVKNEDATAVILRIVKSGGGLQYAACFGFTAGVPSFTTSLTTGTPTNTNYTINAYPNNWYRLSVSMKADATGTSILGYAFLSNTTNPGSATPSYTGDSKSVYLWGAQFEWSTAPTSYMPSTSGTLGSRNQDICSILVSSITNYSNAGTIKVRATRTQRYILGFHDIMTLNPTSGNGYVRLGVSNADSKLFANMTNTSSSSMSETFDSASSNQSDFFDAAFSYDLATPSIVSIAVKGTTTSSSNGSTSTTANPPTPTTLKLMNDALNVVCFKRIAFFTGTRSASQLVSLLNL